MKNFAFLLAGLFAAGTLLAKGPVQDGEIVTKTVNTEKSQIKWDARKVTGTHTGLVDIKEGKLEFRDGKLIGGKVVVDMTTLRNTDMSGGSKEKLENHLKSADFFHVSEHPTATFVINRVVPQGNNNYKVKGKMTIKGITNDVEFDAVAFQESGVANAKITLDRSKYDVRYGSKSFFDNLGDKMIYDEFDLTVVLNM